MAMNSQRSGGHERLYPTPIDGKQFRARRADRYTPAAMRAAPPPARPFRRVLAYAIDWCLFAGFAAATFAAFWFAQGGEPSWPQSPWLGQAIGFVLTTLPFGIYFVVTEGSARQATVGKRVLGLVVIDTSSGVSSGRPTRGAVVLRTCGKLAPWELGHTAAHQMMAVPADGDPPAWVLVLAIAATVLALGYVASLWLPSGRTPYDRLAGTGVTGELA
jgi:uncharacterized RDD family membrane protein YckC